MGKKICKICDEEIMSEPYSGRVYIIQEEFEPYSGRVYIVQEDPTILRPFPTMYFHFNCYFKKHYLKLAR